MSDTRQTQGDSLDRLKTVAMNSFSGGRWFFAFDLWIGLFFCSFLDEHGNNDVAVFVVKAKIGGIRHWHVCFLAATYREEPLGFLRKQWLA
eukprot:jgi/Antlo1/1012/794